MRGYDYFSSDGNAGRETPSLNFKSERTTVSIYDREGEIIGAVPVTFSYANTAGFNYEVTDIVYGDLLGEKPEYTDIVEAIQGAVGLNNSIDFVGQMEHDTNLV